MAALSLVQASMLPLQSPSCQPASPPEAAAAPCALEAASPRKIEVLVESSVGKLADDEPPVALPAKAAPWQPPQPQQSLPYPRQPQQPLPYPRQPLHKTLPLPQPLPQQPTAAAAAWLHQVGINSNQLRLGAQVRSACILHCDAAQAFPFIPFHYKTFTHAEPQIWSRLRITAASGRCRAAYG